MVLCLGIGAFTAAARGSIPGLATEIPYQAAACRGPPESTLQNSILLTMLTFIKCINNSLTK